MSVATTSYARTDEPAPLRRRALLSVVPTGETSTSRAPFAVAVVGLLVTGLIGLLVLNTVLGKDAFKLHALQVEGRQLADREQVLTREVEALRSPATLAEKATALGMVQAGPPAFLQLPSGTVLGAPVPAAAPAPLDGPTSDGAASDETASAGAAEPAPAAQAPAVSPSDDETDPDTEQGDG